MCNDNNEQVQCMDCSEKNDCEIYQQLEETLDKHNQYAMVTLTFKFLITHENMKPFLKKIHKPVAKELFKHTTELNDIMVDTLDDYGTDTFSLCGGMDFKEISNEEAFHNIAEYIKDIHGENSNG